MVRDFWTKHRLSVNSPGLFLIPLALLASVLLVSWGVRGERLTEVIMILAGLYGLAVLMRWLAGRRWSRTKCY